MFVFKFKWVKKKKKKKKKVAVDQGLVLNETDEMHCIK